MATVTPDQDVGGAHEPAACAPAHADALREDSLAGRIPLQGQNVSTVEMPTQPRPRTQRLVGTAADELQRRPVISGILSWQATLLLQWRHYTPAQGDQTPRFAGSRFRSAVPCEGFCRVGTICVSASPSSALAPSSSKIVRALAPQQPDRSRLGAGLTLRSAPHMKDCVKAGAGFGPLNAAEATRGQRSASRETTQPRRAPS